jgi:hypothetical protein
MKTSYGCANRQSCPGSGWDGSFRIEAQIRKPKLHSAVPSLYSCILPSPAMISQLKHEFIMHFDRDQRDTPLEGIFSSPRPKSTPNARQSLQPHFSTALTATELKEKDLRVERHRGSNYTVIIIFYNRRHLVDHCFGFHFVGPMGALAMVMYWDVEGKAIKLRLTPLNFG